MVLILQFFSAVTPANDPSAMHAGVLRLGRNTLTSKEQTVQ
jgi:hypothetical protein